MKTGVVPIVTSDEFAQWHYSWPRAIFSGASAYRSKHACAEWREFSQFSAGLDGFPMVGGALRFVCRCAYAEGDSGDLYFGEHAGQRDHPICGDAFGAGVVQCRPHCLRLPRGSEYFPHSRLPCRWGRNPNGSGANKALEYLCGGFSRSRDQFY